mmetsp:Transcript_31399/g.52991  ORF Transcript_31399/g.52991 Transcript_31399/m.52991 type:complete len:798 (-) Transcript_31399:1310-3703(-)
MCGVLLRRGGSLLITGECDGDDEATPIDLAWRLRKQDLAKFLESKQRGGHDRHKEEKMEQNRQSSKRKLRELFLASWAGDLKTVEALVGGGASVDGRNSHGNTPLHEAVENGHAQCAELLISKGASVQAKDVKGNTSLHLACASLQVACVDTLLQRGSAVNDRNNIGETPLHIVVQRKFEPAPNASLTGRKFSMTNSSTGPLAIPGMPNGTTAGAAPVRTTFFDSANRLPSIGCLEQLDRVMSKRGTGPGSSTTGLGGFAGASTVNLQALSELSDRWAAGNAPNPPRATSTAREVVVEAPGDHLDTCVGLLLAWGANPYLKDWKGSNPVMVAIERGHVKALQLMLCHGHDPEAKRINFQHAIEHARAVSNNDIADLLSDWSVKFTINPDLFAQPALIPAAAAAIATSRSRSHSPNKPIPSSPPMENGSSPSTTTVPNGVKSATPPASPLVKQSNGPSSPPAASAGTPPMTGIDLSRRLSSSSAPPEPCIPVIDEELATPMRDQSPAPPESTGSPAPEPSESSSAIPPQSVPSPAKSPSTSTPGSPQAASGSAGPSAPTSPKSSSTPVSRRSSMTLERTPSDPFDASKKPVMRKWLETRANSSSEGDSKTAADTKDHNRPRSNSTSIKKLSQELLSGTSSTPSAASKVDLVPRASIKALRENLVSQVAGVPNSTSTAGESGGGTSHVAAVKKMSQELQHAASNGPASRPKGTPPAPLRRASNSKIESLLDQSTTSTKSSSDPLHELKTYEEVGSEGATSSSCTEPLGSDQQQADSSAFTGVKDIRQLWMSRSSSGKSS